MDFINDFQKIMRESGETFFQAEHPQLNAQKDSQKNDYMSGNKSKTESRQAAGPLSQMIAAGQQMNQAQAHLEELKQKEIENEQLKAVIEIMKEEMQLVLKEVSNQQ